MVVSSGIVILYADDTNLGWLSLTSRKVTVTVTFELRGGSPESVASTINLTVSVISRSIN